MSEDRKRAAHIVANWRVNFDDDDDRPLKNMIETYLAAARDEGYRAAVEESRRFCARSGGCIA